MRLPQSHSKNRSTLLVLSSASAPTRLGPSISIHRESNAILGTDRPCRPRLVLHPSIRRSRLIVVILVHRSRSHIDLIWSGDTSGSTLFLSGSSRLVCHTARTTVSWIPFPTASRATRWTCVPMAVLACVVSLQQLITRIT